jgi:hypothetical protein
MISRHTGHNTVAVPHSYRNSWFTPVTCHKLSNQLTDGLLLDKDKHPEIYTCPRCVAIEMYGESSCRQLAWLTLIYYYPQTCCFQPPVLKRKWNFSTTQIKLESKASYIDINLLSLRTKMSLECDKEVSSGWYKSHISCFSKFAIDFLCFFSNGSRLWHVFYYYLWYRSTTMASRI